MSRLLAALPMYDWPEVASANDALWAHVSARLRDAEIDAPAHLDRSMPYDETWLAPNLLLSQACGYPFATELRGKVQLVGTPSYDVPGCRDADYSSVVIASRDSGPKSLAEFAGATVAINSPTSQSGYWALRAALAATPGAPPPLGARLSGGHRNSLRMVASGTADAASIDCVSWALALRYEPEAVARLRVIGTTPTAPGLPLITGPAVSHAALATLRGAFGAAIAEPALAGACAKLGLAGFLALPDAAYDRILQLRALALALPFPEL